MLLQHLTGDNRHVFECSVIILPYFSLTHTHAHMHMHTHTDLVSALLVYSQFLHEGININGLLFEDWLQSRQIHFHFVHKVIGLQQFGQTVLHTIPGLYINRKCLTKYTTLPQSQRR